MNDAQAAPGESLLPDSIGLITGIHLVLIALFAVAAIAIILIGIRRKRRRKVAEHVVEVRIEQAENEKVDAAEDAAVPEPARPAEPVASPLPTPAAKPIADSAAGETGPTIASPTATDEPAGGPVTQLKGLGPKVAALLAERGVTTVGDLAALDEADAARIDADLGAFAGRMARDRWVEQARLLAAGDRAGFEAVFGKL